MFSFLYSSKEYEHYLVLHLMNFSLSRQIGNIFIPPVNIYFWGFYYLGTFIRYITYWNITWFICFVNCVVFIFWRYQLFLGMFVILCFVDCINLLFCGDKRCVGFLNHIFPWFFYFVNCVHLFLLRWLMHHLYHFSVSFRGQNLDLLQLHQLLVVP